MQSFREAPAASQRGLVFSNNVDENDHLTGSTPVAAELIASSGPTRIAYIGDLEPFAVMDDFKCRLRDKLPCSINQSTSLFPFIRFDVPWKTDYPTFLSFALPKDSPYYELMQYQV